MQTSNDPTWLARATADALAPGAMREIIAHFDLSLRYYNNMTDAERETIATAAKALREINSWAEGRA